jgi:hypothetical protein
MAKTKDCESLLRELRQRDTFSGFFEKTLSEMSKCFRDYVGDQVTKLKQKCLAVFATRKAKKAQELRDRISWQEKIQRVTELETMPSDFNNVLMALNHRHFEGVVNRKKSMFHQITKNSVYNLSNKFGLYGNEPVNTTVKDLVNPAATNFTRSKKIKRLQRSKSCSLNTRVKTNHFEDRVNIGFKKKDFYLKKWLMGQQGLLNSPVKPRGMPEDGPHVHIIDS